MAIIKYTYKLTVKKSDYDKLQFKITHSNVLQDLNSYLHKISYKNSSGDEIANVNFYDNIAHVEASAYAHSTSS